MTLAHFGFGKNGEVLDDTDLPEELTEPWLEDEAHGGQPYPSYARLLQVSGTPAAESWYSWTVDFAARRAHAREEMKPHLAEAEHARLDGIVIKEKLRALKASRDGSDSVIALEEQLRGCERVIREKEAKARAVDAAVFDLKAVNPNAVIKLDPRSPEELIASIREQGNVMGAALIRLEELVQGLAAHSQPIASCSAQPGKRA